MYIKILGFGVNSTMNGIHKYVLDFGVLFTMPTEVGNYIDLCITIIK